MGFLTEDHGIQLYKLLEMIVWVRYLKMFFKHILTQVMAILLGKMIRQTPIIGWLEKEENGGVYIKKDTGVG